MRDLTIVIVTWNSASFIHDCLKSADPSLSRFSVETLVVDNASRDETVPLIKSRFPWVRLLENKENSGFARANNQAFSLAASRYVLLLNPDTVLRPGAIDRLIEFMDARPEVWAAGPAVLNADGTRQRTGVSFPNGWNLWIEAFFLDRLFPRSRWLGRHRRLYEDPTRAQEVDFVQGSALMVRREVFERVGGLDERFFMYFEETDWCFRMRQAGGKVMICPEAQVVHLGGGEFAHYDERRLVFYHRSLLAFYRKHHPEGGRGLRVLLFFRSALRLAIWAGWAVARPTQRSRALSSARGYARCLELILKEKAA